MKRKTENYSALAKASGLNASYISKLFRGECISPSTRILVDLAKVMDMTLDELAIRLRIRGSKEVRSMMKQRRRAKAERLKMAIKLWGSEENKE